MLYKLRRDDPKFKAIIIDKFFSNFVCIWKNQTSTVLIVYFNIICMVSDITLCIGIIFYFSRNFN